MSNERISDLTAVTTLSGNELIEVSVPTGGTPAYASKSALTSQIKSSSTAPAVILLEGEPGEEGAMGPMGPPGSTSGASATGVNITPDTHPASPSSLDDEFESGTVISSAWTQRFSGISSAPVAQGCLQLSLGAGTGVSSLYTRPLPSPSVAYTVTAKVAFQSILYSSAAQQGIALYQSSTGQWRSFHMLNGSSGLQFEVASWNGTTFEAATAIGANSFIVGPLWIYLRASYDGAGNLKWQASTTGATNSFITLQTETLSTAGFASGVPDCAGLFSQNNSSTYSLFCLTDWIRSP